MEVVFLRFPHLGKQILEKLGNQELANCRRMNRQWKTFIDGERFFWIRIIRKYAKFSNRDQVLRQLLRHVYMDGILKMAMTVQELKNSQVLSPLHYAALSGNTQNFKAFFDVTYFKNPTDYITLLTPLHFAAEHGHLKICETIITHLEDKNPAGNSGITPLHAAAYDGHLEICKLLMKNLDNKNPSDNDGKTPLHRAARKGHLGIFKEIIQYLDDINPIDNFGWTPLHYASCYGYFDVCEFISENIEDLNPYTNDGKTPIYFANARNHRAIVSLLRLAQIKN